jgi:multidrug efflux pump subunit AcrA (membrane-fusion protein)
MDIVPSKDQLVVEARLDPNDIDIVHPGLPAEVRLTSFNMRSTEPVKGKIRSVSADRLTDERSGTAYYLVRVVLTEDPKDVLGGASLYPGMPAEVMIVTGAQTALGYFLKPFLASFNRAFRDQ